MEIWLEKNYVLHIESLNLKIRFFLLIISFILDSQQMYKERISTDSEILIEYNNNFWK